ncbi:MAG: ABC transporter permease [Chloroflexota bacterium]
MTAFIVRRTLAGIVTLLAISFVVFAILELSPADPVGNLPLTIPNEVREQIRESLGVNDPFLIKYVKWVRQFMISEPASFIEEFTCPTPPGSTLRNGQPVPEEDISCAFRFPGSEDRTRIISWNTRSPVMELVAQRIPQTLWVVGTAYLWGILIAIPIGVISAYKQYSLFDQVGSFFAIVGYSIPTFFTGVLFQLIFAVELGWFPMLYDTTLEVTNFETFLQQLRQMILPVTVLTFFYTAQMSRFTRSAMLDNLGQDYIRTARSKGLLERDVVIKHALRNSLIPVVTLIALGIPQIFGGAIITEQIFSVNGLGEYLIKAIQEGDLPSVQTLTFIFAVLIVLFNIIADLVYGFLDPRVVY